MAKYYSAQEHCFFDDAIHHVLPADATRVSDERHRQLLEAQGKGAVIEAGDDGRPRFRGPSAAARRAAILRQVKREASRRIATISPIWRQLNDQRAPSLQGDARFAVIDAVRAASDAIERDIAALDAAGLAALDIAAHPLWPSE